MPDILFDHFCGDLVSHTRSIVSGAPKMTAPQLLLHLRELLKDDFGRNRLKNTHYLSRRPLWSCRDKQMHMIRHQLHRQYLKIVLFRNFVEKFFDSFLYRAKQKGFAIFRYPNQMIFQIVDCMMSSFRHARRISYRKSLCPPLVDSLYIPDLPVGVLQA
jgi:hypothetical protein